MAMTAEGVTWGARYCSTGCMHREAAPTESVSDSADATKRQQISLGRLESSNLTSQIWRARMPSLLTFLLDSCSGKLANEQQILTGIDHW